MEGWVLEKDAGTWDQRKEVENDENYDGMCEKCCDAERGNIQICRYFTRSCTGVYVHYRPIYSRYILMT